MVFFLLSLGLAFGENGENCVGRYEVSSLGVIKKCQRIKHLMMLMGAHR